MYILKNAWKNITRNKGRNILIGIIIIVISAACAVTLAIRSSANSIVKAYENKNPITASISMDRKNLMQELMGDNKSQEDMINTFNEIEVLTEEQIITFGTSDYLSSYYYTYSLGVNAKDIQEATDSLVKETTTTTTETTNKTFRPQNMPQGGPGGFPDGGSYSTSTSKKTTTKKTEKIYNEKAQNGAFTLYGYNKYEDMKDFINGNYTIIEGNISDDFNSKNCIISEELATLNELKVGDTITIVDTNNEKNTYEFTITGIYKENTDDAKDTTTMFTNSANKIITNVNAIKEILTNNENLTPNIDPVFIIKDKESVEKFEAEVKEKGLSDYYKVSNNLEDIENATKSITNVKVFATTFLIITLVIGGVVLAVINMINIRERKYEIGVLRTIGMKKYKLALQFMLELLIVCLVSLGIGAGVGAYASVPVANNLLASEIKNNTEENDNIKGNFGIRDFEKDFDFGVAKVDEVDNINAVVDIKVLGELLGLGILLTLVSSLASMIAISRFSPLNILKERS
ncbi:MAG: ABC transporter permease [Bacilli bacterium]|nr:ABC transporter permease [Bacilli bacterium]